MTDKKKRAGVAGGEKRRAVTGRGKFEDPLTIASQSRDDLHGRSAAGLLLRLRVP